MTRPEGLTQRNPLTTEKKQNYIYEVIMKPKMLLEFFTPNSFLFGRFHWAENLSYF